MPSVSASTQGWEWVCCGNSPNPLKMGTEQVYMYRKLLRKFQTLCPLSFGVRWFWSWRFFAPEFSRKIKIFIGFSMKISKNQNFRKNRKIEISKIFVENFRKIEKKSIFRFFQKFRFFEISNFRFLKFRIFDFRNFRFSIFEKIKKFRYLPEILSRWK